MTFISSELMIMAAFLVALMFIGLIRAVLGPTDPDRIVALDTINTLSVVTLVVLGMAFEEIIYIDVAAVYAMLAFVSTIYVSKYLEDRE